MAVGTWMVAFATLLPACSDQDDRGVKGNLDAGTGGAGGVTGDAGPGDCPDPKDPGVHYQFRDITRCPLAQDFTCETAQNGFYNACGCGCIDKGTSTCSLDPDPRLHFVARDPTECVIRTVTCTALQQQFDNACGCGCIDP